MKKVKGVPNLVTIAVVTVITAVFWIGFEVYRAFNKPEEPVVPREITLPLNPTLDIESLAQLEKRVHLSDSEIGSTQLTIPGTIDIEELEVIASPTVSPTASPAASPIASPTASPSGETQ